jgi:CheY-like chemotaxis protein
MAPKLVLCVDDDPDTLELRKLVLESSGYSVSTATSGDLALKILEQGTNVDLVLLDYLMPAMNGDELAQRLRQRYPDLPLVAISGVRELPEEFIEMLDGNIQKGEDPDILLSKISNVLIEANAKNGRR